MLRLTLIFSLLSLLGAKLVADEPAAIPIIDCHVHLWDLARPEGLSWIKPDNKVLTRNFLPQDFEPIAKANSINAVVVVQAGQSLPDNQWNLDVTAPHKTLYRGVVGNLSKLIGTPEFKPYFENLCKDKRYVGYRLSGRQHEKLTEAFYQDLQLTADQGKAVDFLVGEYRLDEIVEIAKRIPTLRIVLDHFGNVTLDGSALPAEWVKSFRSSAAQKNVYCKVSALYGRIKAQPAPMDLAYYTPILDLAYESFGEDRLIFGSDYPVTEMTGDYASVLKLTNAYFSPKGRGVLEKLFSKNALHVYRIPDAD